MNKALTERNTKPVAATASPATAGRKTQALALPDYAGLVSRFTAAHQKRAGRARARSASRDERGRFRS